MVRRILIMMPAVLKCLQDWLVYTGVTKLTMHVWRNILQRSRKHCYSKGKGKVLPITGHEGPEREQMYSCTLPSTSGLDVVG